MFYFQLSDDHLHLSPTCFCPATMTMSDPSCPQVSALQEDKRRLEAELATAKQEMRERLAQMEKEQSQGGESELQAKFQSMLKEMRDQKKYQDQVEAELGEAREERDRLAARLAKMGEKLSLATNDKHRVEITLEDMRHNLTETRDERNILNDKLSDLQGQIEELRMQVTGRKGILSSLLDSGLI